MQYVWNMQVAITTQEISLFKYERINFSIKSKDIFFIQNKMVKTRVSTYLTKFYDFLYTEKSLNKLIIKSWLNYAIMNV